MSLKKSIGASVLLGIIICLSIAVTYGTVAKQSCRMDKFSTLIVLGCPPDPDGTPSSEERERVMEAVREFRAGRAENIILTGGSPHSVAAEGSVMARIALMAGIPSTSIVVEAKAANTIENIYYSNQIMQQRGWRSAEVISSPSHLARTALVLEHYDFCWRMQASHWPAEYSSLRVGSRYLHEAVGTTLLRWFGFRRSPFLESGLTVRGRKEPGRQHE